MADRSRDGGHGVLASWVERMSYHVRFVRSARPFGMSGRGVVRLHRNLVVNGSTHRGDDREDCDQRNEHVGEVGVETAGLEALHGAREGEGRGSQRPV